MATKADIAQTYDYIDQIVRNNLGDFADLSCAFYDGNYQLTLDQAQRAKHRYILDGIGFRKGMRVLDIGCGWGPVLKAVQDAGGCALGLTLSPKQHSWCRRNGMEAELKDWKDMKVDQYGKFDAVVSVGAFEHFCSVDDYLNGKQDEVYTSFFRLCHRLLPAGGRLYLQTMTWGQNRPRYEDISLKSPRESNEYIVALIGKFYPGSWQIRIVAPRVKIRDALSITQITADSARIADAPSVRCGIVRHVDGIEKHGDLAVADHLPGKGQDEAGQKGPRQSGGGTQSRGSFAGGWGHNLWGQTPHWVHRVGSDPVLWLYANFRFMSRLLIGCCRS
ncbi:MAG: class I SAM-dependent methyltransferase, partial [Chloroflexi bacterium]|nr:class I SAM-dependent methyltransferase [Chloroflexota bacterium]